MRFIDKQLNGSSGPKVSVPGLFNRIQRLGGWEQVRNVLATEEDWVIHSLKLCAAQPASLSGGTALSCGIQYYIKQVISCAVPLLAEFFANIVSDPLLFNTSATPVANCSWAIWITGVRVRCIHVEHSKRNGGHTIQLS